VKAETGDNPSHHHRTVQLN